MYNKRELFFVRLLRLVSYVVCLAGLSGAVSRANTFTFSVHSQLEETRSHLISKGISICTAFHHYEK